MPLEERKSSRYVYVPALLTSMSISFSEISLMNLVVSLVEDRSARTIVNRLSLIRMPAEVSIERSQLN